MIQHRMLFVCRSVRSFPDLTFWQAEWSESIRPCTSGVAKKEGRCKKKCHHRESGTRAMVSPTKDTLNLTHISFADLGIDMDSSTLSSPPLPSILWKESVPQCFPKSDHWKFLQSQTCARSLLWRNIVTNPQEEIYPTHTQNSRGDKFHYGIQLLDFFLTISARA